jgi:archaemetzincin
VPFGVIDEDLISAVEETLVDTFNLEVGKMESHKLPADVFDFTRQQYNSEKLLRILHKTQSPDSVRLLGVTTVDLFIPMLSFVFGQAQLQGRVAVVSTARLRQEFYDLPADSSLTTQRTMKEAIHEIGHTFGLTHCLDKRCPMSLSTMVTSIDAKGTQLCGSCRIALNAFQGTSIIAKGRS